MQRPNPGPKIKHFPYLQTSVEICLNPVAEGVQDLLVVVITV
jgi:hypothetical protein